MTDEEIKPKKTSRIAIRIEPELYDILLTLSKDSSMKLSQFIRCIIVRFHMEYFMGHVTIPYDELKKEFLNFAKSIEKEPISRHQSQAKRKRRK